MTYGCIKFIDKCRFLSSSMRELVKNLDDDLKILNKEFPDHWEILNKKLANPYEIFDCIDDYKKPVDSLKNGFSSKLKNNCPDDSGIERKKNKIPNYLILKIETN